MSRPYSDASCGQAGRRVGGVREWGFGDNVYPYPSLMQLLVIDTAAYVAYVKMRLILAYLAVYLCQLSIQSIQNKNRLCVIESRLIVVPSNTTNSNES